MTAAVVDAPVYAPPSVGGRAGGSGDNPPTPSPSEAPPTTAPDGDLESRFLEFLIPAVSAVSAFAPQIGQAVGGLFGADAAKTGHDIGSTISGVWGGLGGLFGGRSLIPEPVGGFSNTGIVPPYLLDFTGPLVQQCCVGCMGKIGPNFTTMMQGLYPQLKPAGGDSRSAEDEIVAVERFWPEIASFLTQQVATHLPEIMKTVTSAVLPLLGSRDAARLTPMLTGTEANARWFLPVLSSVLCAVQQNLPKLISLLGGDSRAARDTSITWTDVSVYGRFWDNDFIRVVDQQDLGDQNTVQLVLELAPHLSWGKEIQVRDDNGTMITRLHVQDANKIADATIAADQILTNGSLLFAKAKMFGFMTGMYVLPTAGLNELRGKRTHIRWMSD
jgi:hypothetical protein